MSFVWARVYTFAYYRRLLLNNIVYVVNSFICQHKHTRSIHRFTRFVFFLLLLLLLQRFPALVGFFIAPFHFRANQNVCIATATVLSYVKMPYQHTFSRIYIHFNLMMIFSFSFIRSIAAQPSYTHRVYGEYFISYSFNCIVWEGKKVAIFHWKMGRKKFI